jgi:hypothetical protein
MVTENGQPVPSFVDGPVETVWDAKRLPLILDALIEVHHERDRLRREFAEHPGLDLRWDDRTNHIEAVAAWSGEVFGRFTFEWLRVDGRP